MTKTVALFLGTGMVVVIIGIVLILKNIIDNGTAPPSETRPVEITAPIDTQVFRTLPGESAKHIGDLTAIPLALDVQVEATIILRNKQHEKSFPPNSWENGKIVWRPKTTQPIPNPPSEVTVSINAVPWAEVFIRLPDTDRFIIPTGKKSNVTPIRGGLRVPIGTEVKLVYGDKVKTFPYEAWKTGKTISHDFLEPQ